jgi:hypothetical protein
VKFCFQKKLDRREYDAVARKGQRGTKVDTLGFFGLGRLRTGNPARRLRAPQWPFVEEDGCGPRGGGVHGGSPRRPPAAATVGRGRPDDEAANNAMRSRDGGGGGGLEQPEEEERLGADGRGAARHARHLAAAPHRAGRGLRAASHGPRGQQRRDRPPAPGRGAVSAAARAHPNRHRHRAQGGVWVWGGGRRGGRGERLHTTIRHTRRTRPPPTRCRRLPKAPHSLLHALFLFLFFWCCVQQFHFNTQEFPRARETLVGRSARMRSSSAYPCLLANPKEGATTATREAVVKKVAKARRATKTRHTRAPPRTRMSTCL